MDADNLLGKLSASGFLQQYWQQQPLLVRQAFTDFTSPLSADELAGLACETDIESRLILEKHGPSPWYMENGPFTAQRFADLPPSHWTLLVQDVDKYIPDVAALLHYFRFIPDWRIDDIMISYAADQGSVGPHVDHYDVFLLQAFGKRRWQINTRPVADDNFIPDIALNILQQFDAEQEWVLEPGDMLYLPPGVAHYGVADGDCITISIGFRAPSHAQLISGFVDDYLAGQESEVFYADAGRPLPQHPAEIDSNSLASLRNIIRMQFLPDGLIDNWLGKFLTEPKQLDAVLPLDIPFDRDAVLRMIRSQPVLLRNPWSRLAYIHQGKQLQLFAAGHSWDIDAALYESVIWLCDHQVYHLSTHQAWLQNAEFVDLLTELVNLGIILIDAPQ